MAFLETVGGEHSPAHHGVDATHADHLRGDLHLPRGRNGRIHINDLQTIRVAEPPDHDGFSH
jgi:hypothetical protein